MNRTIASQRLARGAKLLADELGPDWPSKVDRYTLDMGSCFYCVLGQLYGTFRAGCYELGLDESSSILYGFEIEEESDGLEYYDLEEMWKKVLKELS